MNVQLLPHRRLEVHREPVGGSFRTILTLEPSERVSPLALPDLLLPWGRAVGEEI